MDGNNAKLISTLKANLMLKVLLLVICGGVDDVIILKSNGCILITCNCVCLFDAWSNTEVVEFKTFTISGD